MRLTIKILLSVLLLSACENQLSDILVPSADQPLIPEDISVLSDMAKNRLQGIYIVKEGRNDFGGQAVLKWSGGHLSIFTGKSASYFILKGGHKDSTIYFSGYWRAATGSATGLALFTIEKEHGATALLNGSNPDSITLSGFYGSGQNQPTSSFILKYSHPLKENNSDFFIIGHRGGGRNIDRLPYSENSLGMITFAEKLGANAVELDIRSTKDRIPVLFHDKYINKRLVNEDYFIGAISEYTFAQLRTFVTLVNGEKIPTLEEALSTILTETGLQLVWLDMKTVEAMTEVLALQKKYIKMAAGQDRDLQILIGIPDRDILKAFADMEDHFIVPSLCELSVTDVLRINAMVWAPRWSLGLINEQIDSMHGFGKKVFIWTLDEQVLIERFIKDTEMDGFITNYPSLAAYEYYTKD